MLRTLILTVPGDYHAHAVSWGLKSRDVAVDTVFLNQLAQTAEVALDPAGGLPISYLADGVSRDLTTYDRVWLRRPDQVILGESLHSSDRGVASVDWSIMLNSMITIMGHNGQFCINPASTFHSARLKPMHLYVAKLSGLEVPKSLFSNSRDRIQDFIETNARNGSKTIVKGFQNNIWSFPDGGGAIFSTINIECSDLDGADLMSSPCIFQEEIEKDFEVRVTVMGRSVFAAKLDSQISEESRIDFRLVADWATLGCQAISVPSDVRQSIQSFQGSLNFNFGCLDFIVDKSGNWVFLETNTMGNFLWVEDINPEICLLDAFVQFIIEGNSDFNYGIPDSGSLRLSEYRRQTDKGIQAFLDSEIAGHAKRPEKLLLDDGPINLDRKLQFYK